MITAEVFIAKAEEIAAEDPRYQHGHDGSDGFCDCIGLPIGSIRRAGGQWRGIHGTNYAARKEMEYLKRITGSSELSPGEVVFKAYEPGQGGYNLPKKYEKGGDLYNGDIRDYYHIGIVESVYPLRIRHMTTPKCRMDTSLGKWAWHGRLKKIARIDTESGKEEKKMEKVTISGGETSAPIHMRRAASTSAAIVADIPQGSEATMIEGGGTWNQIQYGKNTGYVMAVFVHKQETAEGDTVMISRAQLEKIYDEIGDMLGLRG